jgi:hypothetical protein
MPYLVILHHSVHRTHRALAYSAKSEEGLGLEKAEHVVAQLRWQFLQVS